MRHILVHGYYQTKDNIIWDTVKNYFPTLKEQIQKLYDNELKKTFLNEMKTK